MNLVIASNNAHKISEIKIIFADLPLNVLSYSEVFEEKIEAVATIPRPRHKKGTNTP